MSQQNPTLDRRAFLQSSLLGAGALVGAPWSSPAAEPDGPKRRPRVAAVFTEFRFRSHAWNILENFFEPYLFRGRLVDPGVEVVSFYADQFPQNDVAREVSRRFKVPLFDTIDGALCLGGRELAVDAVLSIGEHGDYPTNELGQKMYPRKRFFDEAVAVMKRSKRFVPLFNDKHLSYRWDWAREMYETHRRFGIPLMAGSSVPLAQRIPPVEIPRGAEITEAVSVHGGGLESYDFHGLEVLQSFIEARKGGESGISEVQLVKGDDLAEAFHTGRIPRDLYDAAMQAERDMEKRVRRQGRPDRPSRTEPAPRPRHALLLTHRDGLRTAVVAAGNSADRWNFACRVKGEPKPIATSMFNGPWGNRCLFKALSHAIQYLFVTRKEPYPIERTLLVTGVLEASMRSHKQGGRPLPTPELEWKYPGVDFARFRENGDSWKIITAETPQPTRFEPGDRRFLSR